MAYLADDNKQQDQQQQQQGGQQTAAGASGPAVVSGGGAGGSGGAAQTPWTNIQAYLNANKGTQASSQLLNKTVGGAFDQESGNLKSQAQKAKDESNQAVQGNKIGQDQASQIVQNLGSQYQYNQPQAQGYQDTVNKVHDQLYGQYQGPQQFNYALSGQTQQYGANLGNDQNFSGLMNDVYRQAVGGPLGSGQLALQNQLDTQDEGLQTARQNLLSRYSGLQGDIQNEVQNTNQVLGANKDMYAADQAAARDMFQNGLAKQYKGEIDSAVDAANTDEAAIRNGTNKPIVSNDGLNKHHVKISRYLGDGNAETTYSDYNPMDFLKYQGNTATESNLASVDPQRARFNSIMDILGNSGSKINKDAQDYKHGGYVYDDDAALRRFRQMHPDRDVIGTE